MSSNGKYSYVTAPPGKGHARTFDPRPLLAVMRKDEWVELAPSECAKLLGSSSRQAAGVLALLRRLQEDGTIKQAFAATVRTLPVEGEKLYLRLT